MRHVDGRIDLFNTVFENMHACTRVQKQHSGLKSHNLLDIFVSSMWSFVYIVYSLSHEQTYCILLISTLVCSVHPTCRSNVNTSAVVYRIDSFNFLSF